MIKRSALKLLLKGKVWCLGTQAYSLYFWELEVKIDTTSTFVRWGLSYSQQLVSLAWHNKRKQEGTTSLFPALKVRRLSGGQWTWHQLSLRIDTDYFVGTGTMVAVASFCSLWHFEFPATYLQCRWCYMRTCHLTKLFFWFWKRSITSLSIQVFWLGNNRAVFWDHHSTTTHLRIQECRWRCSSRLNICQSVHSNKTCKDAAALSVHTLTVLHCGVDPFLISWD